VSEYQQYQDATAQGRFYVLLTYVFYFILQKKVKEVKVKKKNKLKQ
jgi:hypothetical protein